MMEVRSHKAGNKRIDSGGVVEDRMTENMEREKVRESRSESMANLHGPGHASDVTSLCPCPCPGPCDETPRSQSRCYRPCRHDCQLTSH